MASQLVEQVQDLPVNSLGLLLDLAGEQHWLLIGWSGLLLRYHLRHPLLGEGEREIVAHFIILCTIKSTQ